MSLTLDPKSTALVLIDFQNGILSLPLAPHDIGTVTKNGIALARALLEKNALVVAVNVNFSDDYADAPPQVVDRPMNASGRRPADWAALTPELEALPGTLRITKRNWGAFYGTELDLQLRRRGIKTVVVCGVSTPIGVEQTVREAWQHSYNVIVVEDATSAVSDASMHEHSMTKLLPLMSRIRSTAVVLSALA